MMKELKERLKERFSDFIDFHYDEIEEIIYMNIYNDENDRYFIQKNQYEIIISYLNDSLSSEIEIMKLNYHDISFNNRFSIDNIIMNYFINLFELK